MKLFLFVLRIVLVMFLFAQVPVYSAEQEKSGPGKEIRKEETSESRGASINLKAPLFSPLFSDFPVATVNEGPITLKELTKALAASHESRGEEGKAGKADYSEVLDRLVASKLIIIEGQNMGLDELPEIKEELASYKERHLREILRERQIMDVKPDDAEVDKLYKEAVKEYKVRSLLFEKEDVAKKAEEDLKTGKDFDALEKSLVESGDLSEVKQAAYVKPKDLLPLIAESLSKMKVGSTSPLVRLGTSKEPKFTIVKLEDIRFPDDPAAKESARQEALSKKQAVVLTKYVMDLAKKNSTVNYKLLKSIDYESKKPGFQKLLKDKRAIVTIKGEKPITVADLTKAIEKQLFHGPEEAIKSKKVNEMKQMYGELIEKRIMKKEALRQGIDKTAEYKEAVEDYRDSLIFGSFIRKAIAPEVKLKEEEVKKYYEDHKAEYIYPVMVTLSSLAFKSNVSALDALDKLQKGTDAEWIKANAEGRVEKVEEGMLNFGGNTIVLKELPEALQKTLSAAKNGDFRLYESPEGYHYIIFIQNMTPPSIRPFEDVKGDIAKKIYSDKLRDAVRGWAEKLKKEYKVEVYVTSNN